MAVIRNNETSWCEFCRSSSHNLDECFCTRPFDWESPAKYSPLIDQPVHHIPKEKYRVIEQETRDVALFSFSPIVRKKYRIEFHDNLKPHWQPHIGAGEFDKLEEAVAWVNKTVDYKEPEPKVVYEREKW